MAVKPTEVEIEVEGHKTVLTGEALQDWKYQRYMQDYLACVQSVDDNVRAFAGLAGPRTAWPPTRLSSTPATRGSSWATMERAFDKRSGHV